MNTNPTVLQLNNITISRSNSIVLSTFSLTIQAGELHWVLGPNGVGKTSLLKAAAGLLPLEEGEIFWNGKPINEVRAEQASSIHYIGHNGGIKPTLSVEENLNLVRAVLGFTPQCSVSEALSKVGLLKKRNTLCRELSAGQQRRVALARLYFLEAQLWILDEPFTAMDEEGVQVISDLFSHHLEKGGAIFTSSHRLFEEKDFFSTAKQYYIHLVKTNAGVE